MIGTSQWGEMTVQVLEMENEATDTSRDETGLQPRIIGRRDLNPAPLALSQPSMSRWLLYCCDMSWTECYLALACWVHILLVMSCFVYACDFLATLVLLKLFHILF